MPRFSGSIRKGRPLSVAAISCPALFAARHEMALPGGEYHGDL